MNSITIPFKFDPRPYQFELLQALDSGITRAVCVWHRRAGKDKTLFNLMVKKALERVGVYYYFFPTFVQGRRVIWDGIDGSGMKFLDHIPPSLIANKNNTEMKLTLSNGSIIQIIGTDDVDRVRGANPVGCVFSEYAFQNPLAWDIVRPILRENGGWAVFNSTPFGKNHFYDMWITANELDDWFAQMVTIKDSRDWDGNPFVTEDDVEDEKRSGMSDELAEQEFYCSFTANSTGFYYLKLLEQAHEENRVGNVPYQPDVAVDTWWDIGVGDSTSIWFTQLVNKEIHVIDFYQSSGEGIQHYAKHLQSLPYVYGTHNFPHDMANTEFGTGRTRIEVAEELFAGTDVNIVQRLPIEDGINAARVVLPRCWFDQEKCSFGLKALYNYHKEWDDKRKEFKPKPVHDWSSHPADAFRYFAVGLTIPKKKGAIENRLHGRIRRMSTKSWMVA